MLRRLEEVLSELKVDIRLTNEIKDFCDISDFTYYVNEDFNDITEIRDILRVDNDEEHSSLKYVYIDTMDVVIRDMLESSTYDKDIIKESYEGIDLIVAMNDREFLESVKDYLEANI